MRDSMENSKMNLLQKLVEIRKQVLYIKKDESGYNFKYASGADIIGQIRPKMDELGVVLIPNMESFDLVPFKKGSAEIQAIKCTISYTWVDSDNPEDKITTTSTFFDDKMTGCQGVGSIMTYAERYFLYKFFQVATDSDSPEQFYKKNKMTPFIDDDLKQQRHEPTAMGIEELRLTDAEVSSISESLFELSKNETQLHIIKEWIEKLRGVKPRNEIISRINHMFDNPAEFLAAYNAFVSKKQK